MRLSRRGMEQAPSAPSSSASGTAQGENPPPQQAGQRSNQGNNDVRMAAARFRSYRKLRGTGNCTWRYGLRQNPTHDATSLALWPSGPLALWPSGPLALWPSGPLALWPSGPLALWPSGPLALWPSGPLALWPSGPLDYNTSLFLHPGQPQSLHNTLMQSLVRTRAFGETLSKP